MNKKNIKLKFAIHKVSFTVLVFAEELDIKFFLGSNESLAIQESLAFYKIRRSMIALTRTRHMSFYEPYNPTSFNKF